MISGVGMGFSSVAVPVLLSEIAHEESRGVVTIMHQGLITLGILVGGLLPLGFVNNVDQGWRYCQGIALIPALIVLFGQRFIPESPKWLVGKGREDEATAVLRCIRDGTDESVEKEMDALVADVKVEADMKSVSWKEVFANPEPVIIGCALNFMQAFTGVNSVVMYSTTIFGFAGFNDAILATGLFGIINFGATMISATITDKYGRKLLLLCGTCIMFVTLVALSSSLLAGNGGNKIAMVAVVAVLTYITGFAIGLGAVVWPMLSELMRTRVRGKAVSLFLAVNWGSNFIVAMCTLLAIDALGNVTDNMTDEESSAAKKRGVGYLYLIFSVVTFFSTIYIALRVPETKGKSPEDFIRNDERISLLDQAETGIHNK
jgi:sugar porter (SP) family MFS transporter